MNDFSQDELSLTKLKQEWDALSPEDQAEYRTDYAQQIVSSHHDAADHPFHRILQR